MGRSKKKLDLTGGAYILNLQAKNIQYYMDIDGGYSVKDKPVNKMFTGKLPYSLDLIELYNYVPRSFYMEQNKLYTQAIVNVNFDNSYKEMLNQKKITISRKNKYKYCVKDKRAGKTIKTKLKLRQSLYENGFIIDGIHYSMLKRSSSKARIGSCLFIRDTMLQHMQNWSRMGMVFEENENLDLASLKAYESLTLSSIKHTITIESDEILLIKDFTSDFKSDASVTRIINGVVTTKTIKDFEQRCDLWDGQSLMDKALFGDEKKGMLLLRNRFFKSAAFNTNIQTFFSDYFKGKNLDEVIMSDMFGNERIASKIKLITTPNSLKLFKFKEKISAGKDKSDEDMKKECYQYWLDNISNVFGVVKSEHESKFMNSNRLSYQIVNSMDFSRDDIKVLMADEIKYIDALNNDPVVFRDYLKNYSVSAAKEFMYNFSAINSKAQYTEEYRKFKCKIVETYKNQLKLGKIKIANTDYCVLFGNPYEFLLASVGEDIKKCLHKGKEIWCSKYSDGEELVNFRNPHICQGNVVLAKNKFHEKFKTYFNLTNNIVIINNFDNDYCARLQGADEDSDECLISNHPILLLKAKESISFPTPIKDIELPATPRIDDWSNNSDVDNIIANNYIGKIINLSQVLNSIYFDKKKAGASQKLLDDIYDKVSMLSSFSQLEIDKAKKYFDKELINIEREIRSLLKWESDDKSIIEEIQMVSEDGTSKMVQDKNVIKKSLISVDKKELTEENQRLIDFFLEAKKYGSITQSEYKQSFDTQAREKKYKQKRPRFFKSCGKGEYDYVNFDTPMDYLLQTVEHIKKAKPVPKDKKCNLSDLIFSNQSHNEDRKQITKIFHTAIRAKKDIGMMYQDKDRDKNEDSDNRKFIQDTFIKEIEEMKINKDTMINILYRVSKNKTVKYKCINYKGEMIIEEIPISKFRTLLLGGLWEAKENIMRECFEKFQSDIMPVMIKSDDDTGIYEFWGVKFKTISAQKIIK